MASSDKNSETDRRWLLWVFLAGFAYAWIVTLGLPLWDDDYTSWFAKIQGHGILSLIGEWLSPISTQPEHWGFNERPLQKLIYKILEAIFGYRGWAYFLFKDLVYGGLGAMIYLWALRLVPRTRAGDWAAVAAAAFFVLAPGPMAALIIYADYAPVAELIFLALTYVIWREVERTPESWRGLPRPRDPAQRAWLLRWSAIAVLTYLGYKSKADLKLIPPILALYVLCVRRRQWAFFAVPLALMALLAVPWGGSALSKLPPFLPGSQGSDVSWMWQPPSLERLREFFWSSQGYGLWATIREPTLSLAAVLGPFLLVPFVGFLLWRMEAFDRVAWCRLDRPADRARLFALLWLGLVIAAISSLAAINYTFRIRYGILPMVPLSLLLGWGFGVFAESWEGLAKPLPRWAATACLALLGLQTAINLERSLRYRHDLGQVMVAVGDAYEEIAAHHASERLALLPDFRPYDFRPDAPALFREKQWLSDGSELVKKGFPEGATMVLSWAPSLWERLEIVEHYSGCRAYAPVDWVIPCAPGSGAWLMRYIGPDTAYLEGEKARAKGDLAAARARHEDFLRRHPQSPAGYFVVGLEAYGLKDYRRSEEANAWLEERFPDHSSILYNHALALEELGSYQEALRRLKLIAAREPANYPVLLHIYWNYRKDGQDARAREMLVNMKKQFPADGEVERLLKGT